MYNNIFSYIIIGITFFLGLITFLIGTKFNKFSIQLVGGSFAGAAVLSYFIIFQEIRDIFVSFAVIFATILSSYSIYQTKKITDQNRVEHRLNIVKDWALEASQAAVFRQTRKPEILWETRLKYKYVWAQRFYIRSIADKAFKELVPKIDNVSNKLSDAIEITQGIIEKKIDSDILITIENELREAAENLLVNLA
jgi:hypothetical protein